MRSNTLMLLGLWLLVSLDFSQGQAARAGDSKLSQRLSRQSVFSNSPATDQLQAPIHLTHKCNATNSDQCDRRNIVSTPLVSGQLQTKSANISKAVNVDIQPKLNASTTPAPRQPGLIARTSDAIYRSLMDYFGHDDEIERLEPEVDEPSTKQTSTTKRPESTPTPPETTPKPAVSTGTRSPRSNKTSSPAATTTTSTRPPKNRATEKSKATLPKTSSLPPSSDTKTHTARSSTPKSTIGTTTTTLQPELTTKATVISTSAPTSTAGSGSSESSKTKTRPTLHPHLDLTSFRDEPHSTTAQTSTTASTSVPEPIEAKTTTTRKPTTLKEVLTTTNTTREPAKSSKKPIEPTTKANTDQELEITPSSKIKPNDRLIAGDGKLMNAQENSLEYFSFLNRAISSIYAVNELTYLNRTTRLVHDTENNDNGAATASLLLPSSQSDKSFAGEREGDTADLATSFLSNTNEAKQDGQAQKLQQQQTTTRDEIMLLCKLLHKQLENGSIITANGTFFSSNGTNLLGSPASSSQKQQRTTSTTTTTPKPRDLLREFISSGLHISDQQNDLNDTHDDHLLESVFSLEKRAANELSYEEAAQRLLGEIFNAGFRRKFAQQLNISADHANNDDSNPPARPQQRIAPIRLRSWSRTITGGRLKLIYWLVMPASEVLPPKFKVLDSNEANELLEELDRTFIKQAIDEASLVRPLVLVTPSKRSTDPNEPPSSTPNEELIPSAPSPNVIEDSPTSSEPKSKPAPKSSGVKDFIDRLFTAPLEENLQIYLIGLIILLFLIVMCFAIPMICCKSCSLFGRRSESNAALTASSTAGRFTGQEAPGENNQASFNNQHQERLAKRNGRRARVRNGGQKGAKHQAAKEAPFTASENVKKPVSSISGALKLPPYVSRRRSEEESLREFDDFDLGRTSGTINEAVWTKLSNSTTTLTKDRTRTMYDDGKVDLPIMRQRQSDEHQLLEFNGTDEERMKRFEWYTFEDKTTTRRQFNDDDGKRDKQSQTLTDHLKMTKSVQTNDETGGSAQAGDERLLNMSFSDRFETRNSDTLTKSELVMLKEKLIPIGREQFSRTPPPPDSHLAGSVTENDEVRELPLKSHDYVNQPTRHIDSSIDDSTNGMSKSLVKPVKIAAQPATSTSSTGDQRTPKMRYLELPGKAQSKMEAIKSELGKLEARELATSGRQSASGAPGTYKRYDVI